MNKLGAWVVLACSLTACGPDAATAPSASAAAPSGSAKAAASSPAASATAGGGAQGKMVNCATSVKGAKSTVADVDKGVEVTVLAEDAAGTDEVRKRAKDAVAHAKGGAAGGAHSGKGGAGGSMGRCPIVLVGTDVTALDVDKGAKITVLAKDAAEVDWLRRETRERVTALGDPASADAGERKMENCPSAAPSAVTAIKEAGGAVVVSVTSKDAAATKEIQARGKKLADRKPAAGEKKHGGSGTGGGKGRCPEVLEGATSTFKDIEGGVEVTIKPDAGGDAKKLLAEAQDRAKRFEP